MTTLVTTPRSQHLNTALAWLQMLGRTLMLPIAVLPIAGLVLRLGQPDMLDVPFLSAAGAAIFSNLGLLFATGVAIGFARENHGAAALAGIVCFLLSTHGAQALVEVPPATLAGLPDSARTAVEAATRDAAIARFGVPMGILSGVISGLLYNRYSETRLPDFLAFFGGRRFVPILAGLAGLVLGAAFGLGAAHIESGMDAFSGAIAGSGPLGLFAYGVLNRVLIVTGLHHILNNVVWFILGNYHGATGDINRFFAGDPTAGAFMSGFFPVMMFGLPAACLAMYHAVPRERRAQVAGMYLSLGLTSFLTGVTEPIEFTFMFVAPLLYALHALLTGVSMALMDALGIKLGFGFSAGLFDYAMNFGKATRPLLLLPVGLAYAALYYGAFRWTIARFDIPVPGREADIGDEGTEPEVEPEAGSRPLAFVRALGGADNLVTVEACTTRLRIVLHDQQAVNEAALKALGSRGVIRPGANALQVVLGPVADQVAGDIRRALARPTSAMAPAPVAETAATASEQPLSPALLAALGGAANLQSRRTVPGREVFRLADPERLARSELDGLAGAGWTLLAEGEVHVLTA